MRSIMFEQLAVELKNGFQFSGTVQIDESLFGRKRKHNVGNNTFVTKPIWVLGLTSTSSDRIILIPVPDRSRETLIPIIKRFVSPVSKIFSDGWAAYAN